MTSVKCQFCKKTFYVKLSRINYGQGIFCSLECKYKGSRTGKNKPCFICNKISYKTQNQLKRSKNKKYFCSKKCQTIWRNKLFVGSKHSNWAGGKTSSAYRALLIRSGIERKCLVCKNRDVRVLVAHHIDENRSNNTVENLVWLCHNCHHLVHHHDDIRRNFMALIA